MKKNLLIFMPHMNYGGVEKNVSVISNYLSKNDVQVEILTCNNDMKKMFNKNIKFIEQLINFGKKEVKNLNI